MINWCVFMWEFMELSRCNFIDKWWLSHECQLVRVTKANLMKVNPAVSLSRLLKISNNQPTLKVRLVNRSFSFSWIIVGFSFIVLNEFLWICVVSKSNDDEAKVILRNFSWANSRRSRNKAFVRILFPVYWNKAAKVCTLNGPSFLSVGIPLGTNIITFYPRTRMRKESHLFPITLEAE